MSQLEQKPEEIQVDFFELMPSMTQLFNYLMYITVAGFIIFPFFAFTLDPIYAIHFWVLLGLDVGLFIALLNFRGHIYTLDKPADKNLFKPKKEEKLIQNKPKKHKFYI